MATPVLGYWNMKWAAQPIRFLLEYTGQKYEDKVYTYTPDRSDWTKEKFDLGLAFPNLPYYIDGDLKLTNSKTIALYIASKHNLAGRTEKEKVQVDMLQNVAYDILWSELVKQFEDGKEEEKAKYLSGPLIVHLDNLTKYLGNKKFFTGENVTYVDFYLYELLYRFLSFSPEVLNKYPALKTFQKSIEALPAIASYMKSEKYKKYFADSKF